MSLNSTLILIYIYMSLITYIDYLQKQNADDLAFYPLTTLEKALEEGRVLTCEDNGEAAGYIWHGPVRSGHKEAT